MKLVNLIGLLYIIISLIIASFIYFPDTTIAVWIVLGLLIAMLNFSIAIVGPKKIYKRKF